MQSLLKKGASHEREFSIPDQQGQVAMAHLKRLSASFLAQSGTQLTAVPSPPARQWFQHVNRLFQVTMQKSIIDIQLM